MTGFTAVLLCGGKSQRMGFDKALLKIEGEYVLLKTVKQLEILFPKVLLVTNCRNKFPAPFTAIEIIEDGYVEKGPLGGVTTALENIETNGLFLMACDIPRIDTALVYKMAEYTKNHDIVICKHNNRLEPLFAFYKTTCLSIFQQQLDGGEDWRIRKNFHQFSVKELVIDSSQVVGNVNTPSDLALWWQ